MTIPPFNPVLALPVAAVTFATGAISRVLAVDHVDGGTLVPLGLAVAACISVIGFVFWFATERQKAKSEREDMQRRQRAQGRVLKYLCEHVPQVDEKHGHLKQLLIEAEADAVRERDKR